MALVRVLLLATSLYVTGAAFAQEATNPNSNPEVAQPKPLIDPIFLLVRDATVRNELKLTDAQRQALDAVLRDHNKLLLAIRDVGPQGVPEAFAPKVQAARDAVLKVLDEPQQARVRGLILQAQGYDALLRPDLAAELKLQPAQVQQLGHIHSEYQARLEKLKQSAADRKESVRPKAVQAAWRNRHQQVLGVLDEQQTQLWSQWLGQPVDFSKLHTGPALAPEFDGVESWLNSSPLTMESLRGRVVVVHFFAFGCINCIHNYPWYREWQDAFKDQDVTIIGIHTPETKTEHDVAKLGDKLRENDLKFAVAVDNKKQMWDAWSNSIWPSVYLIDREGRLRYWWYGELDWKGAGNQRVAHQRIEELLAESQAAKP